MEGSSLTILVASRLEAATKPQVESETWWAEEARKQQATRPPKGRRSRRPDGRRGLRRLLGSRPGRKPDPGRS